MVTRAGATGTIRAVTDKRAARHGAEDAARYHVSVGDGVPELDQRLSDELDLVNAQATAGTAPARELTVQVLDDEGNLAAGMSGWTWGLAAGIGMTWVREDTRGAGLGTRLLHEFEVEARNRGCTHVFVTSFTFQAPGFYERRGYREIFRWDGVPVDGAADVHFRKDL
jgi:GNAT superfamily N-acetyltransferase